MTPVKRRHGFATSDTFAMVTPAVVAGVAREQGLLAMMREKKAAELHYLETGEYPASYDAWLRGMRR